MTQYDTIAGDGDCGTTLFAGAQSLLTARINTFDLLECTLQIAATIETSMGGTSGALYGIFLSAFASGLSHQESASFPAIATAAKHALAILEKYTPARCGDRTLMDALIPFVEAIYEHRDEEPREALRKGLEAAENGFEATRHMRAKLGRASYVDPAVFEGEGVPDPGALGVVAVIRGVLEGVTKDELESVESKSRKASLVTEETTEQEVKEE
jgi:dihydroxyacetone kinase